MSIAIERFGSSANALESSELNPTPSPAFPFRMQCRACGFEPDNAITPPKRCPKCAGHVFERFILPRSLLEFAEQRTDNSRRASIAR
jgi:hypothetical protein